MRVTPVRYAPSISEVGDPVLRARVRSRFATLASLATLVALVGCSNGSQPPNAERIAKSSSAVTAGDAGDAGETGAGTVCTLCNDNACTPSATPFTASLWGDPHVTTFDSLHYDFMGVGEYYAAFDRTDASFAVQLRLTAMSTGPWGGSFLFGATSGRASGASACAANVAGDRVSIDLRTIDAPVFNGTPASLPVGQTKTLPAGGTVSRPGTYSYIVRWPTGEVLTCDPYAAKVSLTLSATRPRVVAGLFGTPNGDPGNDLETRAGAFLPIPPSDTQLYGSFGASWKLTDRDSIFAYQPGESASTFAATAPSGRVAMTDAQRAAAMAACRAAGITDSVTLEACITDVFVTGDATGAAANAAANAQAPKAGITFLTGPDGRTYRIDEGAPGAPSVIGCADGQREGLNDLARFPHVAACLGTWDAGKSLRASPTGAACGDDKANCAVPADVCARGWHVCGTSGDAAELQRLSASDCETAGGGVYMSAMSNCVANGGACSYAGSFGCFDSGACAEAVCCGAACGGTGSCPDGVWPAKTHIAGDGDACGAAHSRFAGGVLCCDTPAASKCAGVTVDDGNPCTRDSCDPVVGVVHTPLPGQSCSDNNACNGVETCNAAGACVPGVAPVVDDGNACTTDACDPLTGVTHAPRTGVSCNDGNVCNGDDVCSAAGFCQHLNAPAVDDHDACTADSCDPITGVHHTALATDDGNVCTADGCDATTGVYHTPLPTGSSCSDGNACNGAETCDGAAHCATGLPPVVDDGNACTFDSCDPKTGVSHVAAPAGSSCSDGNVCNGAEVCGAAGACLAGTPLVVDDNNPCTADSCDASRGPQHVTDQTCVGQRLLLATGYAHSCELKPDGTPNCWGDNTYGQATAPAGETFVQIAAGDRHTCGLRANGTMRCWGDSSSGQQAIPAGVTFTQIGAGKYSTCGVRTDGGIQCWGGNYPPSIASGVYTTVAAGDGGACGLKGDGSVVCSSMSQPVPAGSYTQITFGNAHACAVRNDGVAVCWGNDNSGRNVPPTGTFTQVSSYEDVNCGVTTTGALRCWGYSSTGQLTAPAGAFTRVSVGGVHACAVRTDGVVMCWGLDDKGEAPAIITPINLVNGTTNVPYSYAMAFGPPYSSPTAAYSIGSGSLPPGITLSSAGVLSGTPNTAGTYSFSVSYTDGANFLASQPYVITIRDPLADGQACTMASQCQSATCMSGFCCTGASCVSVSAGDVHTCELRADGVPVCWGSNSSGQATPPAGETFVQISAGKTHTCGLRANGTIRCWGDNYHGELNVPATDTFVQVSASQYITCGLRTDGGLRCWGLNPPAVTSEVFAAIGSGNAGVYGLRPDGSIETWGTAASSSPTTGSYTQITGGDVSACAIRTDSAAVCWGTDVGGKLKPPTGVAFAQISTSSYATCGITTTGTVQCWGLAGYGPTVAPAGTFRRVSVGTGHACAVRTDGAIICWGANDKGQAPSIITPVNLVNGTTGVAYSYAMTFGPPYTSATPSYAVGSGTLPPGVALSSAGVLSGTPTAAGTYSFTIVYSDGTGFLATQPYVITIRAPLADGQACTMASQCQSATCMSGFCCTGASCLSVSAGDLHTCELKADGTAVCWGSNASGQATVPAGETFVQISAGKTHTCGLRANGTIRCWGDNGHGELNVPATDTFVQVSASQYITCGLRTDGGLRCWGLNAPAVTSEVFAAMSSGDAGVYGLRPDGSIETWGVAAPKTPTGAFSQIAAGDASACALRSDGSAACWGNDVGGKLTPPTGVTFAEISTALNASCGITGTGTVRCWGLSNYGQLAVPTTGTFTRISVGTTHVCAVRSDNAVVCWGTNDKGQTTVPG